MKTAMIADPTYNQMDAMNELDETLEFLQDALFDETLTSGMAIEYTIDESRDNIVVSPTSSIEESAQQGSDTSSLSSDNDLGVHTSASSSSLSDPLEQTEAPSALPTPPQPVRSCWTEQVLSTAAAVAAAASPAVTPVDVPSSPPSTSPKTTITRTPQLFGKDASYVPIAPMPAKSSPVVIAKAKSKTSSSSSSYPKKSAARNQFLKAVAVAVAEQRVGPGAHQNKHKLSAEEQFNKQRERNRFLAKQTRERKKVAMSVLKDQFAELQRENQRLQQIVQDHLPETAKQSVLAQNSAVVDEIPKVVWDACGCDPNRATPSLTGTKRKSTSTPPSPAPLQARKVSVVSAAPTVSVAPPAAKKPCLITSSSAPAAAAPTTPGVPVLLFHPPGPATAAQPTSTADSKKDLETSHEKSTPDFNIPNPLSVMG